jgi:hypothetical protein
MLRMSDEGLPVNAGSVFSALESEGDRDLLTRIAIRAEAEEEPGPEALESCLAALRKERWVREGKALKRRSSAPRPIPSHATPCSGASRSWHVGSTPCPEVLGDQ